eukprot:9793916-Ditylum_brightwellii.AAC.1
MDTPNYWQAMNRPDAHLFEEAMEREMEAMTKLNAWEEIDISEVTYTTDGICCTVIESTWAFKAKRCPDRTVKKHKAQLCVHGNQQVKDVDYFETYSPVLSWTTVRMMMTLAVNLGLKSRQ